MVYYLLPVNNPDYEHFYTSAIKAQADDGVNTFSKSRRLQKRVFQIFPKVHSYSWIFKFFILISIVKIRWEGFYSASQSSSKSSSSKHKYGLDFSRFAPRSISLLGALGLLKWFLNVKSFLLIGFGRKISLLVSRIHPFPLLRSLSDLPTQNPSPYSPLPLVLFSLCVFYLSKKCNGLPLEYSLSRWSSIEMESVLLSLFVLERHLKCALFYLEISWT